MREVWAVPVTVSQLAVAPVKGMRLQSVSEIEFGRHGVTGDREFLIVGQDGTLVQTIKTPALLQVEPAWDRAHNVLALRFPGGRVVTDSPAPGPAAVTWLYNGREVPGRLIPGPLSAALSHHLGEAVYLFRRAAAHIGNDDHPATLMSEGSLRALAQEFNGTVPSPHRFRMTVTIAGAPAWAEHGWGGQSVSIGAAALRVVAPVPRCAVTTRNPESGATDARILHALARLRGKQDVTFGVWCDILRPGRVHVGDLVTPPDDD